MDKKSLKLRTPVASVQLRLSIEKNQATNKDEITANLCRLRSTDSQQLAFTYAEAGNCYISAGGDTCMLWMHRTGFDLNPEDAELVASTFGIRLMNKTVEKSA